MGSLVLYIMEWAFALIVLLTIYKAVFSGTTFYRFNRFYLLGATVLSALLPLVHISIPEKTPVVSSMAISDTEFAQELSGTFVLTDAPLIEFLESDEQPVMVQPSTAPSMWAVILVCMYSGYVIMLMIGWSRSIIRARRFLRGKPRRRISRTVWLVTHHEVFGPFSWMNYIVISDAENGFARRASLRHEYSHVKLLHSLDLVFLLACTIVNPVCWLVLQEIKVVHEYEADHEVINRHGIRNGDYQKLLIMRTVGAEAYALASSFNLNIKKRIIMLNKNQTGKRRLMWLLILIPALGITSVLFARTEKAVNLDDNLRFTSGNAEFKLRMPEPERGPLISIKLVDEDNNPVKTTFVTVERADREDLAPKPNRNPNSKTPPPPPAAVTRADMTTFDGYVLVPQTLDGHKIKLSAYGYETQEVTVGPNEKEMVLVLKKSANPEKEENVFYVAPRNHMTISVGKDGQLHVKNGLMDRDITIGELKSLIKQFIQNPDNDSRLPSIEEYDPGIPGYDIIYTTLKHIMTLWYEAETPSGIMSDVRYETVKAYNEVRDELCMSKFGTHYDQCSDNQQLLARAYYPMKIADPISIRYRYDSDGKLNLTGYIEGTSAVAGKEQDDNLSKDLRIKVTNNPLKIYASTVLFENVDGKEQLKSESSPQEITMESLNDYITQAISDGKRIRYTRFMIHPDAPEGVLASLKGMVSNRLLLSYIQESYK